MTRSRSTVGSFSKPFLYFLCILALMQFIGADKVKQMFKHTDIVLIGGMGDLSKKYLLRGFFNLISKHTDEFQTFSFYPSGRTSTEIAEPILSEILEAKINCDNAKEELCEESKKNFLKVTKYVQLNYISHYQGFCNDLKSTWKNFTDGNPDDKRVEVIFYLSIPSSGYLTTASFINKYCRIKHKNWSMKVVMEKPFGQDRHSANSMSIELSDRFNEEEIYRVDHYLGKTIVKEILNFRKQNKKIESLLNKDHVERVEIFMKETLGVKGRIEFYDQTGVIKDVFQNHLTELLTLVAMEIPQSPATSAATEVNKLKFLKQIEQVKLSSILLGQYADYMKEAEQEGAELQISRFTPTFAATVLKITSPRWRDVPVVLAGGKNLDERSGYVRIVFKRNLMCIRKCKEEGLKQLVFHIGHGDISSPAIVMSKSLGEPIWPVGFTNVSSKALPSHVLGQKTDEVYIGFPADDPDAYTVLIEDLFGGVKGQFVGTNHLLALWDIWSDVATKSSSVMPRIYESGDSSRRLTFRYSQNKLEFMNEINVSIFIKEDPEETRQTPSSYLGHKLITTDRNNLAFRLAKDIADCITETLVVSNFFHIAFSGGKSPVILFETLAQHFPDIPWEDVHIWQVDERCVPPSDKDSNFRALQNHLLDYIRIPHFNIHPMPVDIGRKLCSPRDDGAALYQESLENELGGGFDYIVLGLGTDGHTASLFPHSLLLKEKWKLTAVTDRPQDPLDYARMTLTLHAINRARMVSVFVTGKEKQGILKELEEKGGSVNEYPILGVNAETLTWYIEDMALP